MANSFTNKVVLITGSSSGIGAATAVYLAKLGASVSLTGRNAENLAKVAEDCSKHNGGDAAKILTTVADLTKAEDQKRLVDATLAKFGYLDVLVNNAGSSVAGSNIQQGTMHMYDTIMNINVRSVVQLTQLCIEPLKATKGNVVNVSSVAGLTATGRTMYAMAKAAVNQFTRCFAAEMAPFGVRVNAVNPAVVRTAFFTAGGIQPADVDDNTFFNNMGAMHPLGRVGEADEIAMAIAHLAHHTASAWTTGVLFPVDGGMLLAGPLTTAAPPKK